MRTYPVAGRFSKVKESQLAKPYEAGSSFAKFITDLPDILGAADLLRLADAVVAAKAAGKPVIIGFGAHLIKCGLAPLLIDAVENGLVDCLAVNGACLVHDTELSNFGNTSEDVGAAINDGSFGMATETAAIVNGAIELAATREIGLGKAMGYRLTENSPHPDRSIMAVAYKKGVTVTVHLAVGTDIVHMHPGFDGAAAGAASHLDFRKLCTAVGELDGGGVYINIGSAVILPEVFLKALSVARNIKGHVEGFTTANLDFIRQYRPTENVVTRPTAIGNSCGISIIGQHELLLPLLFATIKEKSRV